MKAIAIQTHAIGDPTGSGEHWIAESFVEHADGVVTIQAGGGWKQLQPLSEDEGYYRWVDGPAGTLTAWNKARVNGQVITLAPHGSIAFSFGWGYVEV